jgi:hypothetical protein
MNIHKSSKIIINPYKSQHIPAILLFTRGSLGFGPSPTEDFFSIPQLEMRKASAAGTDLQNAVDSIPTYVMPLGSLAHWKRQ